MSGSLMENRPEVVLSAAITKSAGGALTVGPFPNDVIVQRIGALVTTTTATNPTSVTTSPDIGSLTIPTVTSAGVVVVKNTFLTPAAGSGAQKGQYVLASGSTLTVTGAAAAGAGVYNLFAEIIRKPIHVDGVNVLQSA